MDDVELVAEVIAGDQSAAEMLVERFSRAIMGTLTGFRGLTKQDAEDLFQKVFGQLFERDCAALRHWQGDSLAAYIKRIARNFALDLLSERRRQQPTNPVEDAEGVPDGTEGPEAAALLEDLRRMMHAAIGHLTVVQRDALVAVDIEGLSYCAAAINLGVTLNNLTQRLHNARQALARVVSEHYPALLAYLERVR